MIWNCVYPIHFYPLLILLLVPIDPMKIFFHCRYWLCWFFHRKTETHSCVTKLNHHWFKYWIDACELCCHDSLLYPQRALLLVPIDLMKTFFYHCRYWLCWFLLEKNRDSFLCHKIEPSWFKYWIDACVVSIYFLFRHWFKYWIDACVVSIYFLFRGYGGVPGLLLLRI